MAEAGTIVDVTHYKRSYRRLVVSGVVLSAGSCALVLYTGGAEPFIVFHWSDLALNVGLGTVAFALFTSWAVACVRNYRRAPRRRALATGLLCASVLWSAINLFYLGATIYGYAVDMNNPRLRVLR